ncbi:FAD-binding domain oxidoreductase [Ceratobasidium theobromae]|uniref:FAD-binding domain oxidoreductase n=1 Tax=Ceratobasidium theobromae TaxID=1582974 RepID=A0A5N5QV17_9AGAM|nr:FAD-binding domain oxidoreductase [Ceratobasidium theobromae]
MLSTRVRTCCRARPHIFLPRVNSARHYARLNSTTAAPPTTPPQKSRSVALTGSLLALAASLGFYGFHVLSSNNTSAASGPLSDQKFAPLKIISSTPASENAKIITLAVPSHLMPDDSALAPIFSFFIKDSDIQVQRPYTPLDGIDENGNMSFWIKRYFDGEVSRWLHNKNIGEELEVRGPVRTFDFKDGDYDEVIMISGGTGVTPFVQLLNHIFAKRTPGSPSLKTHYTLLHSSPNPASLPITEVLYNPLVYSIANRHDLTVRLFVDIPAPVPVSRFHQTHMPNVGIGRIGKDQVVQVLQGRGVLPRPQTWLEWVRGSKPQCSTKEKKILFLVCGPEPMITAFSGSRLQRRRPEHLPVGGLLGELGFTPLQVKAL